MIVLYIWVISSTMLVVLYKWNKWCFKPRFSTHKAILGRGQPGLIRWILLWNMPLVQDRSLDLLTSSPTCYHWATDAPNSIMLVVQYEGTTSYGLPDRNGQPCPATSFITIFTQEKWTSYVIAIVRENEVLRILVRHLYVCWGSRSTPWHWIIHTDTTIPLILNSQPQLQHENPTLSSISNLLKSDCFHIGPFKTRLFHIGPFKTQLFPYRTF